MKLTATQRQALIAARDFGNAWKIDAIRTLKTALEAFDLGLPIIA